MTSPADRPDDVEPANMTVAEVMALTGLGRQSVYDGCSRNEIPHRRVGKRIIFSRQAVMEWFHSPIAKPLPHRKAG